jgi:mRNA-degrading endonuclease RelE of RelBE toxin-antitoxin system
MYKIKVTKTAEENLDFIKSYIWDYSKTVIKNIFLSIWHLAFFPKLWFEIEDWFRELIDSKYKFRIIYKINQEKNIIYIISIFKNKNTF